MPVIALRDDSLPDPADLLGGVAGLPAGAPLVVMIHGFRYSPARPALDPHRHILGLTPEGGWGAVSWPRRLGLGGEAGVGLAWGWDATGSIWQAHRRAEASGEALAGVLARLHALDPDRPIHLIAHSLGARVALAALRRLSPGAARRVILLAAAVSAQEARSAAASAAGRAAEVVNVTGVENRLFDALLRAALPGEGRRLGPGCVTASGWLDLPLDRPEALAALAALGWRVAPARARVCHWSSYLRPGVWGLYRSLLLDPGATPLPRLRQVLGGQAAPSSRQAPRLAPSPRCRLARA